MARRKPKDPRGGHVRIYWELLDSPAWRALGYTSQALYVTLRRKLTATSNGNISAALGDLKHYGFTSSSTVARALRELKAAGFIAVTRQGGIAYGNKVCTLYRFTDEPVPEWPKLGVKACKATNEWRQFERVDHAKNAVRQAHENKSGLRNRKRIGSESEAQSRFIDSESKAVAHPLLRNRKRTTEA